MAGCSYTPASSQPVYDSVLSNCHFEHKLHVLSVTSFSHSIVSEDMNMISSAEFSVLCAATLYRAHVLTFG